MKRFSLKDQDIAIEQLLAQINGHVINSNNAKFNDLKDGKIKFVNKLGTITRDQLEMALAKYATLNKISEQVLAAILMITNDVHKYVFDVICTKAAREADKNREAWKAEHHPSEKHQDRH